MPLEDFLAKKEKNRVKKKINPNALIEQLQKTVVSALENNGELEAETKNLSKFEDEEWVKIEDEDSEDNLLDLNTTYVELSQEKNLEEEAKSLNSSKEKKAWGSKPIAVEPDAQPVQEPQPTPEPAKPSVYVPVHLRPGGSTKTPKVAKPNVTSDSEFPTLDMAATSDVPKPKEKIEHNKAPVDDGPAWMEAGTPYRTPTRPPEAPPVSSNLPTSNSYVPPSLRRPTVDSPYGRQEGSFRNEMSMGRSNVTGPQRSENFAPMANPSPHSVSWSRGKVISTANELPVGVDSSFSSGSSLGYSGNAGVVQSGQPSNVMMKTFKESNRGKAEFELTQSNRFSGLT